MGQRVAGRGKTMYKWHHDTIRAHGQAASSRANNRRRRTGKGLRCSAALDWALRVATGQKDRPLDRAMTIRSAKRDGRRRLSGARYASPPSDQMHPTLQDPPGKERPGLVPRCLVVTTWLAIIALALAFIGGAIYAVPRSVFLGLRGPDFGDLSISDTFDQIQGDDYRWEISLETDNESEYSGVVRHTLAIRIGKLRILTHDILVTSGDFADPAIVSTSVSNHRYRWVAEGTASPQGRINLLHTVPVDEEVFRQLDKIESGDNVTIVGQEILRINVFDLDGRSQGDWRDQGCNTLLVHSMALSQSSGSKTTWPFGDRSTRESPLKTGSYSLSSAKINFP